MTKIVRKIIAEFKNVNALIAFLLGLFTDRRILVIVCIIRPRRSRSAAAYSRQTFPWTICRSVRMYVRASVGLSSALWKNGVSDPDAVWHRRSDGSRDEAGGGVCGSVDGNGYFWNGRINICGATLYPMRTLRRICATAPRRGPLSKLLWTDLIVTHTHK